jgi:hypothetical protein
MLDEREWLTPEILATQEAEIRRIHVQSQPGQIVLKILSQKNPTQNRTGGVAFKPQYRQNKQKPSKC